jgi:uncharacterized protein
MSTYMARLGAFQFSINTAAFQELQRASEYRWEAKQRIGRKPAQQSVGQGADTIRLSGTIFPHYRGGAGQMGVLRGMAATGEPFPLVYAFESAGQYCGRWCIASIEETRTVFFSNGAPRQINFSMTLVEYGEDAGATLAAPVSITQAVAVVSSVDVAGAASEASKVAASAKAVATQSEALSKIAGVVQAARNVATTVSTAVRDVMNSDAVRLAKDSINEFNKAKEQVRAVQGAISSVAGIIENPSTATTALANLQATAGTLGDVLGTASDKISARAGVVAGGSVSSLHDQQVKSVAAVTSSLSSAVLSISSASDALKGHF